MWKVNDADNMTHNFLTNSQEPKWHLDELSDFHLKSTSAIAANSPAPITTFCCHYLQHTFISNISKLMKHTSKEETVSLLFKCVGLTYYTVNVIITVLVKM